MKKRIISDSYNIRINVGNYQHIEIVKQAQEEISYESESERVSMEENLSNDLINSIIRSMRQIPSKLGKGVSESQEVEEAISSAIPKWLNENPPNIMDESKKKSNKVSYEQRENKEKCNKEILSVSENSVNGQKNGLSEDNKDGDFDYFIEKVKELDKSDVDVREIPFSENKEKDSESIFDDDLGIFNF